MAERESQDRIIKESLILYEAEREKEKENDKG